MVEVENFGTKFMKKGSLERLREEITCRVTDGAILDMGSSMMDVVSDDYGESRCDESSSHWIVTHCLQRAWYSDCLGTPRCRPRHNPVPAGKIILTTQGTLHPLPQLALLLLNYRY